MSYSYLNFSDDYDLDVIPSTTSSTGKKLIIFPHVEHVKQVITVQGRTKYPLNRNKILVKGTAFESSSQVITYKAIINTIQKSTITGSTSRNVTSKATIIGSKLNKISESILIKGKKDYIQVINQLEKLVDRI
ncbi:MAG: hypothetical protein MT336_05645 [Candidatus Nitrosopumilus limneticus]|jgi:hypothetical protein|nr:hypothetical protein [Candidatus Nitrosopumilus limneticus]